VVLQGTLQQQVQEHVNGPGPQAAHACKSYVHVTASMQGEGANGYRLCAKLLLVLPPLPLPQRGQCGHCCCCCYATGLVKLPYMT
jgi:hypothetical protein